MKARNDSRERGQRGREGERTAHTCDRRGTREQRRAEVRHAKGERLGWLRIIRKRNKPRGRDLQGWFVHLECLGSCQPAETLLT